MKIEEVGFIEKGTGKHQSNVVYSARGVAPTLTASLGVKTSIMILDLVCATNSHIVSMPTMQKESALNNSLKSTDDN